eukprot:TRINITY_DN9317_c0_g1_i2.p1 TRINITY_DN9317_c0_g1~~TRINITY_DN9317_c0_g1_i2.p1  ORF type:complete len:102 (+),score=1.66 TRINITY_DN9317_c0_g1_i2:60-365(+)
MMSGTKKKQKPRTDLTDEDEDLFSLIFNCKGDVVFRDTVTEVCLFLVIILTFGFALFLRKGSTERSRVHHLFRPIDFIMYDPEVDIKIRNAKRLRKRLNSY